MQYSLTIDIDSNGLQQIYAAGQSVTIVKSVISTPLASGNLPVAWISFQPLQTNSITWEEDYYIYATTTALIAGATIIKTSMTTSPAQLGQMYTLEQGTFLPTAGGASGVFSASNEQGSMFSFGLSQFAVVNGTQVSSPLNAVRLLNNEFCSFTPQENVAIFLSNSTNNGVVLSQIYSSAANITLSSQSPSASVGFRDSNNTFFQTEGPSAGAPLHQRLSAN